VTLLHQACDHARQFGGRQFDGTARPVAALMSMACSLAITSGAGARELSVTRSYAACKNPATVEQFEDFERREDDQGYKHLYLSTAANGECIFLRAGEILDGGDRRDRWICIKPTGGSDCYWTAASAVRLR
jgi:hypothetical protein